MGSLSSSQNVPQVETDSDTPLSIQHRLEILRPPTLVKNDNMLHWSARKLKTPHWDWESTKYYNIMMTRLTHISGWQKKVWQFEWKFFLGKIFWGWKFFGWKYVWVKIFFNENFLGEYFLGENFFGGEIFLGLKFFGWKFWLYTRIGFLLHLLRFYWNTAKSECQVTPFTPFLLKHSKKWKSSYSVYSVLFKI